MERSCLTGSHLQLRRKRETTANGIQSRKNSGYTRIAGNREETGIREVEG